MPKSNIIDLFDDKLKRAKKKQKMTELQSDSDVDSRSRLHSESLT